MQQHIVRYLIAIAAITLTISTINITQSPKGINGASLFIFPDWNQTPVAQAQNKPITTLKDLNDAFVSIAEQSNQTVVTVFTRKQVQVRNMFRSPFDDFFGAPRRPRQDTYIQQGMGSGVIVSADGYILTNNHVINNADSVFVQIINKDRIPAKVIGTDPKTDLAVIKIEAKNLPALSFGDSDQLRVGEMVLAIGSPLDAGLAHTVTFGIVSAKGRSNLSLAEYEDFIQTDAAINPGNSGGALVNMNGELIGINTAIASRSGANAGIGFSIPSKMAQSVMESLIKTGKVVRGYLGVVPSDVNAAMAKALNLKDQRGVILAEVEKHSPAEKSGLKEGDVVISIKGRAIKDVYQFRNEIANTRPGTEISMEIIRHGKRRDVKVTLGELEPEKISDDQKSDWFNMLRFSVTDVNAELVRQYRIGSDVAGVVVTEIETSATAYQNGLREGDLILSVNQERINNEKEFYQAISKNTRNNAILLRIIRQGRGAFVAFEL